MKKVQRQGCGAFKRCGWAFGAETGPTGAHGALASTHSRAGRHTMTLWQRVCCSGRFFLHLCVVGGGIRRDPGDRGMSGWGCSFV